MGNLHWCLHLHCTALSQSQYINFFRYMITALKEFALFRRRINGWWQKCNFEHSYGYYWRACACACLRHKKRTRKYKSWLGNMKTVSLKKKSVMLDKTLLDSMNTRKSVDFILFVPPSSVTTHLTSGSDQVPWWLITSSPSTDLIANLR